MHGVTYRFRIEARARGRAWLTLAMLVGAVAGTSLVLLAGSRRTGSACARFAAAQHRVRPRRRDVVQAGSAARRIVRNRAVTRPFARLGAVEDATTLSSFPAFIETLDGRSIEPDASDACYSGPGDVETLFDESGRFGRRSTGGGSSPVASRIPPRPTRS